MLINNNPRKYNKGDTIIEVLFAISIFSLVVVGGLSIMNKGTNISQNAIETTMVRHQIDAQVETLRYLNSSYIGSYNSGHSFTLGSGAYKWHELSDTISLAHVSADDISASGSCPSYTPPINNKYVIDTSTASFKVLDASNFSEPMTYAKVEGSTPGPFKSYGIWIEAVSQPTGTIVNQQEIGYIDFYIYACWGAVGQPISATDGTIVRLYEPR